MPENSILSPVSLTSYFDNATGEARQANLFFYKAGTLDPITAYTDAALYIPFPQPVATTGWGRVPPVYIGEIPAPGYRVRAFDQYQTLIEDLDGLPGALPTITSTEPIDVDQTGIAKTGDIKLKWVKSKAPELGWVEITQGGTIGNVGSNATLLQHEDAHALFLHLWQQDAVGNADVALRVIPSKGANAEGDWTGESGGTPKQIEVPDCRGRFLAGLDAQVLPATTPPTSTSGRLDKGLFGSLPNTPATKWTPWNLGGWGGEAVHQLLYPEMAVHSHDWIDYYGHSHFIWEPGSGHKHTLDDPGHSHGLAHTLSPQPNLQGTVLIAWGSTGLNFVGGAGGDYLPGQLLVRDGATGISMGYAKVNARAYNYNFEGAAGTPGAGSGVQYIGAHSTVDNYWHQPTEYFPRTAAWPVEAERGDKPHNTLPPFILFAIYMKL